MSPVYTHRLNGTKIRPPVKKPRRDPVDRNCMIKRICTSPDKCVQLWNNPPSLFFLSLHTQYYGARNRLIKRSAAARDVPKFPAHPDPPVQNPTCEYANAYPRKIPPQLKNIYLVNQRRAKKQTPSYSPPPCVISGHRAVIRAASFSVN